MSDMTKLSTYVFPAGGLRCYYFTANPIHAIDIIRNKHLFASLPSNVNDPNDLKLEVKGQLNRSYLEDALVRNSFTPEGLRFLQPQGIISGLERSLGQKTLMDRVYRFVCFAKADCVDADKRSAFRFWQKYAKSFGGVRFEFLIDKSFTTAPAPHEVLCDEIKYGARSAILDLSTLNSAADIVESLNEPGFMDGFAYTKSQKWSCEYELRIGTTVRRLNAIGNGQFVNFDGSRMIGISIGERVNRSAMHELLRMSKLQGLCTTIAKGNRRDKQISYTVM